MRTDPFAVVSAPVIGYDSPMPFSFRILFFAFLALFATLVAAGLHGLSIGCWDDRSLMPPEPEGYRYRELGTPRWERADDWNVSVPQIMAPSSRALLMCSSLSERFITMPTKSA